MESNCIQYDLIDYFELEFITILYLPSLFVDKSDKTSSTQPPDKHRSTRPVGYHVPQASRTRRQR